MVTPYTVTYNGNPHTATVTSITGVNGETGATVGTVDVNNTTHTNAGTYASDSGASRARPTTTTSQRDDHRYIDKANATVVVTPTPSDDLRRHRAHGDRHVDHRRERRDRGHRRHAST